MENQSTEGLSSEVSEEEIFVELESDELCSDSTVVTTVSDAVVISSSTNTVCDSDEILSVSSSVSDHTLTNKETSSIGLSKSITDCSRNEEGRTTLSQTATPSDNIHLYSGGNKLLPVSSVPVAVETEATDGQVGDVSGTTSFAETSCVTAAQSLSSNVPDHTMTNTETSSVGPRDTAAVCHTDLKDSTPLSSHATTSCIGVHMGSGNVNFTDISQAKSVNLLKLATYSGLKYPRIVVTRINAMPRCLSEVCVSVSSTASSTAQGSVIDGVPSIAYDDAVMDNSLMTDSSVSATANESVMSNTDGITGSDGLHGGEAASDGDTFNVLESEAVESSDKVTKIAATDESLCHSVGTKRPYVGDSVEGSPCKQQKVEDISSSVSLVSVVCCNTSQQSAEHPMNTEVSSPSVVANTEVMEKTSVSKCQQEVTYVPTDSNLMATEDVTMTGQLVVGEVSSINDAVADNDSSPDIDDAEKTSISECQQEVTCAPDDLNFMAAEDVTVTGELVVDGVSSLNNAVADNDSSLAPDIEVMECQQEVTCMQNDSNFMATENVILAGQLIVDEVSSANDTVAVTDNPLAPISLADSDAEHQQKVMSATSEGIEVSAAVEEVCVATSDASQLFATLTSTAAVASNISSALNSEELGLDAIKNSEILNVDVVASKSPGVPGASRALILPPPPSVTNAGSKMRMRMEAANREKPASATLKKCQENRPLTVAAKETAASRLDGEQTAAVSNTDIESSDMAIESGSSSDDEPSPELSGQGNESPEQILSTGEQKIETFVGPPPRKVQLRAQRRHLPHYKHKGKLQAPIGNMPCAVTVVALEGIEDATIPAVEAGVASNEKSSCEQFDMEIDSEVVADENKIEMDWRSPPSRTSTHCSSAPTEVTPLLEWKPAPRCRPVSSPVEIGQGPESNIKPRTLQLGSQSANTTFCLPQNVTHDQDLRNPAVDGQQPLPDVAQPVMIMSPQNMIHDQDLRNLPVNGQKPLPTVAQPVIIMSQPSLNIPPCNVPPPSAGLAPVVPRQLDVPTNVVSGQISGGQAVVVPVQVNTGQPPPKIGFGPPPAVHPPPPVQSAMVPPPMLNCQVPPPMVAGQCGQQSIPGVVLPPASSVQPQTPPRVMPPNIQSPQVSFSQPPPSLQPITPPNVSQPPPRVMPPNNQSPQISFSVPLPSPQPIPPPNVSQTPPLVMSANQQSPQASFSQPPPSLQPIPPPNVSQAPPRVMSANQQSHQASFSQPPPSPQPVPPPNVSPQSQIGLRPGQPVPPGTVQPLMSLPPQMTPAVPDNQPPLLQGPRPDNIRFGPNHPPPHDMMPHAVPPPHQVPPVHHPPQQFPFPGPPGPGQPPPHWGPFPQPCAAPPMWGPGPPPQGIPPPEFGQPYPPGVHNPAVPQEWRPPPLNQPGASFMQPGLPGPNWRPPMDCVPPNGGWWAPPPAYVPQWGPPHGPGDWSYPAQPEPGTGSEFLDTGYNAETASGDRETASLAHAAREWADWQQRYSEWYYTYCGYSAAPAPNTSSATNNAVTKTSAMTKASVTEKRISKNTGSTSAPNTGSAANNTIATTSVMTSEKMVSKSNASAIPLPVKEAVAKPGTADAFAKFAEKAAANINCELGISSIKPPQSTAISSSANVSNTSVTPSSGEFFCSRHY